VKKKVIKIKKKLIAFVYTYDSLDEYKIEINTQIVKGNILNILLIPPLAIDILFLNTNSNNKQTDVIPVNNTVASIGQMSIHLTNPENNIITNDANAIL